MRGARPLSTESGAASDAEKRKRGTVKSSLYVPIRPIAEYRQCRNLREAAHLVAADARTAFAKQGIRTKIEAYVGQRGWTFGVRVGEKSDGTPRFQRSKEADAVRKWFQRNVLDNQQEAKRTTGIWATIESDMKRLRKIRRGLNVAEAKAFSAGLESLVKRFGTRSGRRFHNT